MPISPQEKKYLKNKHKGGNNNSKGNIYESFYTIYHLYYGHSPPTSLHTLSYHAK